MKKEIFILLLILTLLPVTLTQDIDPVTGLPKEINQVKEIGENPEDFLTKEFNKLENNSFMSFIDNLSYLNPLFKITLGMEFSLSFLFFLNLIIWITLVISIFRILEFFNLFSPLIRIISPIITIAIISYLGLTPWISEQIINSISTLPTWWMQLIVTGILIIALITLSIFSRSIRDLFKGMKTSRDKQTESLNRERLKQNLEITESFTKGLRS